jgi:hypothetical protein
MKTYLSALIVLQLHWQEGLSFAPPSGYRQRHAQQFVDRKLVVAQGTPGDFLRSLLLTNHVESNKNSLDQSTITTGDNNNNNGESKTQQKEDAAVTVDDDRLPASDIVDLLKVRDLFESSRESIESMMQKILSGVNGDSNGVNGSNKSTYAGEGKNKLESPIQSGSFDGQNFRNAFEDTISSDGHHKAESTLVQGDGAIEGISSNGRTDPSSESSEEDAWMRERPRLGRGRGSSRRKTRGALEMEAQKAKDASTINSDVKGLGNDETYVSESRPRALNQATAVVADDSGVGGLQQSLSTRSTGSLANADVKGFGNHEIHVNKSRSRTVEQDTAVVGDNGVGDLLSAVASDDGSTDDLSDASEETGIRQAVAPFFASISTKPQAEAKSDKLKSQVARQRDSDDTVPPSDSASSQGEDSPQDVTIHMEAGRTGEAVVRVYEDVPQLQLTAASEALDALTPNLEVNGSGTLLTVKVNGKDNSNDDMTINDGLADKDLQQAESTDASEALKAQFSKLHVNSNGTSLAVTINGKDDNNDDERVKRFNEYNATSMEELRRNVEEAKEKSTKSKERVHALQQKVDDLQHKLDEAESEFQQYTEIREEESNSIVARVDELENLLQMKADKRNLAEDTIQSAARMRQEILMKEIETSRAALRKAEAALDEEKDVAAEIESRIIQAEEQMVKDKSAFEGDEKELLATIQEGRAKIDNAETQIQRERDEFEVVKITLGRELQRRITSVAETNARLQLEQSLFSMNQAEVQRNIDDIKSKLRATEQEVKSDGSRFQEETNELQKTTQELRALLKDAESKLETEKRKSKQAREDLDMRLIFEVVKARNLSEKLKSQQDTFRQEIDELEQASADTRIKLADAQGQLENARALFLEDKETLQDQVADEVRIRTLKVKQMAQRYSDVRQDLTEKWQDERRKARSERIRLDGKYKSKLSGLQEAIPLLERELAKTRKMTEDLYVRKANTVMEKAAILKEIRRMEMSYIQKKSERNSAISALEDEIDSLTKELSERDEKLVKYKSSLRAMLSLSIKLTGKRIRAVGRRLLGPFRRKPSTRSSQQPLTTVRRSVVNGNNEQ